MEPFDPRLPLIAAQARVKPPHVHFVWHALKALGKGFHADACAQFAGLETRHIEAIITALSALDCLPEGRAKVTRKATRLPDDWEPPNDWLEWAIDLRQWQPADVREEAEIFANYWQAKAGKDACKVDWRKTWQNWCRSSRRPDGDYRPLPEAFNDAEYWERTAAFYDRMGRTTEAEEIRRKLTANVVPINRASR